MYSVGHAHDCSWIRSFPDTNPRVRWQRALAQTIAPFTTNIGPDNYGWNYNGMPASKVLHWFPKLSAGTYTGASQAAWSLAGNSNYIVLGGEFPQVNGIAQQGLVRMAIRSVAPNQRGPTYTTSPPRPTTNPGRPRAAPKPRSSVVSSACWPAKSGATSDRCAKPGTHSFSPLDTYRSFNAVGARRRRLHPGWRTPTLGFALMPQPHRQPIPSRDDHRDASTRAAMVG